MNVITLFKGKNFKLILILFVAILILAISFISIQNETAPKRVIKDSVKYKNMQNIDKLQGCYSYDYQGAYRSIDSISNIESMKIINIELVKDESIYYSYMHNGRASLRTDLSRKDIKIYNVKYDIKYKDDSKAVVSSGEYLRKYYLLKEGPAGEWKISDVGQ